MFEFVLRGRARAQYQALTAEERMDVDRAIQLLELDPWVDNVRKAELPMPPLILWVDDDGRWRMSYRVVGDRFLEIYAISSAR